ncbi:MAG: Nramp family divalent metal transporter [Planctomycetaceae bacterium]|nr:Nramp family divalent metal transporter [Planctomycetaceae bacterium]
MTDNASSISDKIVDRRQPSDIVEPPTRFSTIVRQIGPGLIIAANIVGSGELVMTTKTGAEAGISLLWLIIVGCLVKVFVQLELGRFTISHGETTLTSLNHVPGPRIAGVNWVVAVWGIMMVATIGQLGGIVGGVGQALAITFPLTGDYRDAVAMPAEKDILSYAEWKKSGTPESLSEQDAARFERQMIWVAEDLERLGERGETILDLATRGEALVDGDGQTLVDPVTTDDRNWVIIIGVLTAALLFVGRYGAIEKVSVVLVVSFTLITIGNVIALQSTKYAISGSQILQGLSFGLPGTKGALLTALAAFGIIGVGATELISYPYWCLEKGYARSAGPRDESEAWHRRAAGWFRVMEFDAFASMVIYTAATAAFFFLGVAVLHSEGRNPEGTRMVSTLAQSYVPIFGEYAKWLFLSGAIAVLYSTYLVANAGNARMIADFIGVIGLSSKDNDSPQRKKLVRTLSTLLPLACVGAFLLFQEAPVTLIVIAGLTQAVMLPILAFSAMYFRHNITDRRLHPGKLWDFALAISSLALLIAGLWGSYKALEKFIAL